MVLWMDLGEEAPQNIFVVASGPPRGSQNRRKTYLGQKEQKVLGGILGVRKRLLSNRRRRTETFRAVVEESDAVVACLAWVVGFRLSVLSGVC